MAACPSQDKGSQAKQQQLILINQQTEQADAAFLLAESALDMDLESPGSRPLASVNEVAACMRELAIYYDPLAVDGQIMQATAADGTPAFCLVTEPAESQPHVPAIERQSALQPNLTAFEEPGISES